MLVTGGIVGISSDLSSVVDAEAANLVTGNGRVQEGIVALLPDRELAQVVQTVDGSIGEELLTLGVGRAVAREGSSWHVQEDPLSLLKHGGVLVLGEQTVCGEWVLVLLDDEPVVVDEG